MRALLAIENLGEEPLNTTLRDAWCNPVELVITQRVGKNNPVTPTDDDRAMAMATLIEYLGGDYDVGIVIARDRRVEILIEHYIKQLREGRDFCHVIRDSDFRARCYGALNMPSGNRSRKLLTFNVIRTTTFMAGERELTFYLRGALYFLTGVRLNPREAGLLIDYIRNGWRGGGPELLGEQGPEPGAGCTPPQATTDFNLIVSIPRGFEYRAARELRRVGNALGNPVLDVMPTGFDGLVTARVRNPVGFVHGLRRLVDTGYALQYILRVVPVEAVVRPGINDIASTVCVKLDEDLARWLRRVSRNLPYSEEEVIIHLLKSFRDTWLLVENAIRNETRTRWLDQVAKYRWLILEFMKWLGGRQLASASVDDVKAFLNARGVTNWNTFNTYQQALRHAIILAKSGVDLEKILNTGRNKN